MRPFSLVQILEVFIANEKKMNYVRHPIIRKSKKAKKMALDATVWGGEA